MYYKIFSNCKLIDGFSQSLVYDLQREVLLSIPLKYSKILKKYDGEKIDFIFKDFDLSSKNELKLILEQLVEMEIIMVNQNKFDLNLYPSISNDYFDPSYLSSLIITLFKVDNSDFFLNKVLKELNDTRTKFIQIRLEKGHSLNQLEDVLNHFNYTIIKGISLVIDYEDFLKNKFQLMIKKYLRISNIIIYNCNEDLSFLKKEDYEHIEFIKYSWGDFPTFNKLNEIRFLNMNPNIIKYIESLNFNLYYNKKAFVTSNGNVFNSPDMENIKGNIFNNSLLNIIDNKGFKEFWKITKDMIKECKDCQFRYSCVDSRIPIKNKKSNEYYFKTKCKYNPYKNLFNNN